MKSPALSIVIPTLEEEKYLHIALDSLKNQTFKDFEIIIVDGGSRDNTLKIAGKYTAKISVKNGANVCLSRDLGVRKASSEIIVGVDADSYYPPDYLETVYGHFKNNSDIVAVTGKIRFHNCPLWWKPVWWFLYTVFDLVYRFSGVVVYAPALHFAFRKSAFMKVSGYNTNLDFGGDEMDFLSRLKKVGKILYITDPVPQAHSRRLNIGFFEFFFKHLIYNYWINYLSAKLLGKAIIRAKPVR